MASKYRKSIFRTWLWELCAGSDCQPGECLGGMRNFSFARCWLSQFKTSVVTMFALRNQLACEVSGLWRLDRATDDMIVEAAARLLSAGIWHVHTTDSSRRLTESITVQAKCGVGEEPTSNGTAARANPAGPVIAADQKLPVKTTWIEIRLLDEEDQPVAGEKYEIRFPDGSMSAGTLNAKGSSRHVGIAPGQCEVRFPNIEANEWKRV